MVQAIVFLPLLGAILAGLISIFGAHARNPSGGHPPAHPEREGAAPAGAAAAPPAPMTGRVAPSPVRRTPMMIMPPAITATAITRSSRRRRDRAPPS